MPILETIIGSAVGAGVGGGIGAIEGNQAEKDNPQPDRPKHRKLLRSLAAFQEALNLSANMRRQALTTIGQAAFDWAGSY